MLEIRNYSPHQRNNAPDFRTFKGQFYDDDDNKYNISAASHSKPRPVSHCRVLPPGEFFSMIPEPLSVYAERFTTTVKRLNRAQR